MNQFTANSLATYVAAIEGLPSPAVIVARHSSSERWHDQELEVTRERTLYRFANGVVLACEIEQDDQPQALVCAECWISYDVVQQPPTLQVTPDRKGFDSRCRQAFWLKMQCR